MPDVKLPLSVAVGIIALDCVGMLYLSATFSGTFFRMCIYGGLIAYGFIKYHSAVGKMEYVVDGFVIKQAPKIFGQSKMDLHAKISGLPGVSGGVPVSIWPPVDVLGWTPFNSLAFARGKSGGHFWSKGNASSFNVRSVGYKSNKSKEPSAPCLYECLGVDLVRSDKLITNLTPIFQSTILKDSSVPYPWLNKDNAWSKALGIPRIIIINMQLPYSAPSLWTPQSPETDPGFSIVSYYALSPTTNPKGPAIDLLKGLIAEGKSTKEGIALKTIGMVENMDEIGFPEMARGYNGKPVLVTKSAKLFTSNPEILEIEFDVRMWSILARKSLHSLRDKLSEAVCQVGMLIEGRTDNELPEQMLGCYSISCVDIQNALKI